MVKLIFINIHRRFIMKSNFYEWLEAPEEMVGFLFWKITYLWQREMNNALKDVDLTHGHFALLSGLAWLEKDGKQVTQTKLADTTQKNIMATSKILRIMEKRGLVERKSEGKDSRAKYVHLTHEGLETMEKASKITERVNQEFFKSLDDEKDRFTENLWTVLYTNFNE